MEGRRKAQTRSIPARIRSPEIASARNGYAKPAVAKIGLTENQSPIGQYAKTLA